MKVMSDKFLVGTQTRVSVGSDPYCRIGRLVSGLFGFKFYNQHIWFPEHLTSVWAVVMVAVNLREQVVKQVSGSSWSD